MLLCILFFCFQLLQPARHVTSVKDTEPKAKEYLNKLSKEGSIESVKRGWYWIPIMLKDVWDFLEKDQNFKAVSFWNNDFQSEVAHNKISNGFMARHDFDNFFCSLRYLSIK